MNPQRNPLPPLPVQPEMPARPELSSFSFSSRMGTPTLLARMGHDSRSPFAPFGKASSLQQQVPPQHSSVTDTQMPNPNPLMAAVGDNLVNSTDPRGLQPADSAGQPQPTDLDAQLSPDSWGTKSPIPLNALALNDLWVDAERVQNEWASVERTPVVPSLSPTKTHRKVIDSPSVNVTPHMGPQPPAEEGHSTRCHNATTNESSHKADPASNASTNRIKQENGTVKSEELETRIKKEDDGESLEYLISSSIGRVTTSALLNQEPKIPTHRSPDLQSLSLSQSHQRNAMSAVAGFPTPTRVCLPEKTKTSSLSQASSMGAYLPTTLKENSYHAGEEPLLIPGARQTSMTGPDISHSTLHSDNANFHPEAEERLASTPRNAPPVHAYQAPTHREGPYNRPSNPNTIGRPSPGLRTSLRTVWAPPMDGSRSPPIGPRNYRGVERPPRNQRSPPPCLRGSSRTAYLQRDPRAGIRGEPYTSPGGSLGRRHVRSRSPSPRIPYQTSRRRSGSPNRGLHSIARGRSPPSMPGAERHPPSLRYSPAPYALPVSVMTSPLSNHPTFSRSFSHSHSPPRVPLRRPSSDGYLRSPASSGSRVISRVSTPHHFTRDSPPQRRTASLRRSHAVSSAPLNGLSDSYARAGSDRSNNRSKDKLQEDRIQTSPSTPESRSRYEPQPAQALKRTLVDAGLYDGASDKYGSSTIDFSPRQRRRIGSLDRGSGHSAAIEVDSSAPKEFPNGQARQSTPPRTAEGNSMNHGSESSLKVPLWSRMAGNSPSSSLPLPSTAVGLPSPEKGTTVTEDLEVSTLAQPVDGIEKDRVPINKDVVAQNEMPTLRLKQALGVGTASKAPMFEASRIGGLPLSERIAHGTPVTHASSKSIIPSQSRRFSMHRPSVPLVNRLGAPGQTPLPYTNNSGEFHGISLVHRIKDNAPVSGHNRSPPYTGRGA